MPIKRRGLPRSTGLIEARADCEACPWSAESDNAVGLGAQHFKRTGHGVMATQTTQVHYHRDYAAPDSSEGGRD